MITAIKENIALNSSLLKTHVTRYALIGLMISFISILLATIIVSYQLTGSVSFRGLYLAQVSNPAIWALDLTPLLFAYWGQSFCYGLASRAESIIEDKEREYQHKNSDLKLKLQHENNYDKLTHLPSRSLIIEKINQAISQNEPDSQSAVIIININHFKNINYNFGVFNGNNILKQFSEKLKSTLLDPFMLGSYKGMNMVARLQNDEFAVLLPKLSNEVSLIETISYLRNATTCTFMIDGLSIDISTTVGAAVYPIHGKNAEELLNLAIISVFNAHKQERSHAIYHTEMKDDYVYENIMLDELKHAMEEERLEVFFQPIIDLKTGQLYAGEALIRFGSENMGIVDAEKIIPLIENSSLNKAWTIFMLEKSIEQLALWHKAKHKTKLSLNLSAADVTDMSTPSTLKKILRRHGLPASSLCIEITERACLNNQIKSFEVLSELSSMGMSICIQDFCSGYSSFVYLSNFPITHLKIDRSFIMNMMTDDKKLSLITAMIKVAKTLKIKILAIGIKDEESLYKLKQLGCDYGQGFYFSPAVDGEQFRQMFDKNWTY